MRPQAAPAGAVQLASFNEAIPSPTAASSPSSAAQLVPQRVASQFDPFEEPSPAADDTVDAAAAAPLGAAGDVDPFEANDRSNNAVGDTAPTSDPFEARETADSSASDAATANAPEATTTETTSESATADPFAAAPAQSPTSPAEELRAADEAIEKELVDREAQQDMQAEMPAADGAATDDSSAEMERELPGFDDSGFSSNLDDQFGEDRPGDKHDDHADDNAGDDADGDAEEDESPWWQGEEAPKALTPEQEAARQKRIQEERVKALEDCRDLQAASNRQRLADISLNIALKGDAGEDYPFECGVGDEVFAGRSWAQVTYRWKASGLCHKPLYFEQVHLERYGHSWGPLLDPVMSGAHFFATLPILPYKMGLQTPNECVYTLGYYRPGSCAPYMIDPLPFSWRAAAFQAGAVTGTAFVIP